MLPQPKEATKKAPKKVGQVKKKCLDGRKGAKKRHQWEFVTQDPCSIDLSVLQSHQAPSPILVIDLSELLLHQAPSPILVIDRLTNCWESRFVVRKATKRPAETSMGSHQQ